MLRNSSVISISLPPEVSAILNKLVARTSKTKSEIVKDLLVSYYKDKSWEQIFKWGRQTKEKYNIQSEADILKIIND